MLQLILVLLLTVIENAVSTLHCPNCGKTPVPYPLSTSSTCGDQMYKVRCVGETLWFDALNGSSYVITSISPNTQTLTIRMKGFDLKSCRSMDLKSGGIWLNNTLPFNITDNNTVLKLNCSSRYLSVTALDCSSTNPCNAYINVTACVATKCTGLPCCSLTTGGSKTAYRIDISGKDDCTAQESFVGLDSSLPISKWPQPGLEIQWEPPREPSCMQMSDCRDIGNATCLPDAARASQKRCFCNSRFQWDPTTGICIRLSFVASAIILIVLFFVLVHQHQQHIQRAARRKLVKEREDILNSANNGKTAKLFSGKEIKKSTNNFAKENLLGVGGFGEVYKGVLDDGTLTAVKRAKLGNILGMDQVLNEVRILCQVNHRSLVQVLGCCVELEQPVLVYEYVANGILSDHLHGRYSNDWGTLTWSRRLFIAQQIAQGLTYLHFSAMPPIFHRDIKSSNILLDEKLDAKVSDFGLSRLVDTEATHISTCAQGTLGYLDPEYYKNFQLTDRSDVYSFGVVVLELLTSKKAIDFNREDEDVNLVIHVSKLSEKEKLMDAVDPGLTKKASSLELETMKALGLLALACVDEYRVNRPSMREVADELEFIISLIGKETKIFSKAT
ncbi:wall-associated receptor kinase-like 20 [Silene latifolia]|uniref:wall-associated receptor kinase-like 20 n=1 Tax=Silene latifolia TaxID=37657 RepID=UPI003D774264